VLAILVFGVLPSLYFWELSLDLKEINSAEFMNSWSSLNHNVRTRSKWHLLFYLFFILRRILYASTAFTIEKSYNQILALCYLNLMMTVYVGVFKPLQSTKSNRIEIMNEVFVTISTYNLMLFTDFVDSQETKVLCGWFYVAIVIM
jgi:hypothetical protein